MSARSWDLFCRVIDNHGDLGVCWRLAADLAARGEHVRLWVDDASALRWMAPDGVVGVTLAQWPNDGGEVVPADIVVEAFGCELPPAFIAAMSALPRQPVWINLEYLSAEAFVERCHGLVSPQLSGPGAGLLKWFFYPGFTARTGGLIREVGLQHRQQSFDRSRWLANLGALPERGERVVSLFCYEQPALPALIAQLGQEPTLLLLTAGHATRQSLQWLGPTMRHGALRAIALPSLSQTDYDHLLWASDLNFVRGEDSFVRAQWAGQPFVWQIYPQDDAAHLIKLQAFLDRHLTAVEPRLAAQIRQFWTAWNTSNGAAPLALPPPEDWRRMCVTWRDHLLTQADLCSQLLEFVDQKRSRKR